MSDLSSPTSTTTTLSPVDAILFVLVILVSLTSGIYQGWFETFQRKKDDGSTVHQVQENGLQSQPPPQPQRRNSKGLALASTKDGGSVLKDILFVLTCCMSVCLTSAVPTNVYETGMAFAVTCIPAIIIAHIISLVIVVPVFRPLEARSPFEDDHDLNGNSHSRERFQVPRLHNYLRLRFQSAGLTCFAVFLVFLLWIIVTCVVLYIVACILHQISYLSGPVSIIITILIATIYTGLEGKSRLLWTDVILALVIFVGLFIIFLLGVIETGGYRDLIDRARHINILTNGRENLNEGEFSLYPTDQSSFITIFIGQLIIWICVYSGFHSADSRFSSGLANVESPLEKSRGEKSNRYGVVVFNLPFIIFLFYLLLSVGLVLTAFPKPSQCFSGQDEFWSGQTMAHYLAGRLFSHHGLVGFAGLFLAAQVSHSLSITSTGFYSLINKLTSAATESTGVMMSPLSKHVTVRILSAVSTLMSGILVFAISGSSLLQTLLTGISSILGILLAMHLIGLFVPFANGRGVLSGTLLALILCSWMSIGGLVNSPGINQPSINYRTSCNLSLGTNFNNGRYGSWYKEDTIDVPQKPSQTAAAAAGAAAWQTPSPEDLSGSLDSPYDLDPNQLEDSPSHIIVSGRPNRTKQPPNKPISSSSLPRSPVSSYSLDLVVGLARASSQQMSSPSLMIQQQQQLQQQMQQQQQQQQQDQNAATQQKHPFIAGNMNPNIHIDRSGNKPPLILGRPEEGSGGGGFQIDSSGSGDSFFGDSENQRNEVNFFYRISSHLYGFIGFVLTFIFGIFFSGLANLCKPAHSRSRDTNWKEDRVDPLLFHPIVRSLCCCVDQIHGMDTKTATEEEDLAQILTKAALERRKSQMIASIEERNGLDRAGSLVGSYNGGSELLRPHESTEAASLSRRCSRHSRRSQRSSLGSAGQPGGAQVSTTAEVLVVPPDSQTLKGSKEDIKRKLSQLSDDDVQAFANLSLNELSRRTSNPAIGTPNLIPHQLLNQRGGSFRHNSNNQNAAGTGNPLRSPRSPRFFDPSTPRSPLAMSGGSSHASPNQHFQLQQSVSQPQQQQQQPQQHLTVPVPGHPFIRPNLSPTQPMLLAPPNASQLAQRRFSEVDAAIERHNSRRQAKRSQSVMYRQNQQQVPQRRNRTKRSGSDVNSQDVEAVQHNRRRESRAVIMTAPQQQLSQLL